MMFLTKKIISGCESRGDGDSPYLTRLTLIGTRNWQLCLHIFHRSDNPEPHDHPWAFRSLILWPGYIEHTPTSTAPYGPLALLRRPAEHVHWVQLLRRPDGTERPCYTLVWMGKRTREWGFHLPTGWMPWRQYFEWLGCKTVVASTKALPSFIDRNILIFLIWPLCFAISLLTDLARHPNAAVTMAQAWPYVGNVLLWVLCMALSLIPGAAEEQRRA